MSFKSLVNFQFQKKYHFGAIAIFIGTLFLYSGNGAALGIADNVFFFTLAILCNAWDILVNIRYKKLHVSLTSFVLLGLLVITGVFALVGNYDRGALLSMFLYLSLFLTVNLAKYNNNDLTLILDGIILSSVIFSVLLIFFGTPYLGSITDKITFVQVFGKGIEFEPNYLGLLLSTAFCIAVYRLFGLKKPIQMSTWIRYGIMSAIILIGLFLTGSRSAMVTVAIFVFVGLLLYGNKRSKQIFWGLCLLGVIVVVAGLILDISIIKRLFNLRNYFDNSNAKRINDWLFGIKAMMEKPIWGYGPILTKDLFLKKFEFHGEAHNTFITIGIYYGIPILIAFLAFIVNCMLKLWKSRQRLLLAIIVALIFELNILACQFTIVFWLMMIILYQKAQNTDIRGMQMIRDFKDFLGTNRLTKKLYYQLYAYKAKQANKKKRKHLQKNGLNLVQRLNNDLEALNFQFFFDMGTMLGLVREGRLLSHDLDIDIGLLNCCGREDEVVKSITSKGYQHKYRFTTSDGTVIEDSFTAQGIKFDVNYYTQTEEEAICYLCFRQPEKDYSYNSYEIVSLHCDRIDALCKYPVGDFSLSLPQNHEKLLEQKYGETWKIPDVHWKYWKGPNAKIENVEGIRIVISGGEK